MTRRRKLRTRLERSKGVCRRRDIVRYYAVHGFESREGGNHTVFHHPRHPDIMGIVARHRMLDVAYAKAALRAADKLFERQPGGRGREMSEADRYMALPYTIEVKRDERRRDAFHVARVVEFEGCIAQGRTEAEVRSELRDAQRLFIETMLDNGVPVPEPRSSLENARSVTPPITRSSPSPA